MSLLPKECFEQWERKGKAMRLAKKIMEAYRIGPEGAAHHRAVANSAKYKDPSQEQGAKNKTTAAGIARKASATAKKNMNTRKAQHARTVERGDGT